MSAPSADFPALGASTSSSGYTDGLGRRAMAFDREDGTMLERLVVRAELSAFERSLRDRVERISALDDERLAKPRSIERSDDGSLVVLSEFVPGTRLSEVLDTTWAQGTVPGVDVALGYLLDVLPALCGLHAGAGFSHGAISPGRTVLTPAGQVVLLDGIFGDALSRLQYSRRRLWDEFGVAMPPSAGPPRFDAAADIAQAVLSAVMLVLGRPLADYEYPDAIPSLLVEVVDVAQIRGTTEFATALQRFLQRSLPLAGRRPYAAVDDALFDARDLARALGADVCRRALLEFIEQVESGGQISSSLGPDRDDSEYGDEDRGGDQFGEEDSSRGTEEDDHLEVELNLDGVSVPEEDTIYDLSETSESAMSLDQTDSGTEDSAVAVPEFAALPEPLREPELGRDAFEAPTAYEKPADDFSVTTEEIVETVTAQPLTEDAFQPLKVEPVLSESVAEYYSYDSAPATDFESAPSTDFESAPSTDFESAPITEQSEPEQSEPEPVPEIETPEESGGSRRRKRTRSVRSRKDKLRSTAQPPPPSKAVEPEPLPPPPAPRIPVSSPIAAKPTSGWIVEPGRAASFEPPVPPPPAAPPILSPPPPPPPAPVVLAPPPPPIPQVVAPPPVAAPQPPVPLVVAPPPPPIRPIVPAPPPVPLAPVAPPRPPVAASPAPVPLKLKTDSTGGFAPPRKVRAEPVEDLYSPRSVPSGPVEESSAFPWKLASAAVVLMVVGVVAGRAYLPNRSEPEIKSAVGSAVSSPPTATPSTPAASSKTGRVQIVTEPAGARVLLGGKHLGDSPLTVELPVGRHTLTLASSSGSVRKVVRVEAGKTVIVEAPIYSGWVVVSAPIVLDVAEGGRSIGTTEQNRILLRPGRHELTFSNKELDFTSTQTVEIEPGEDQTITVDPRGTLNLNATPWAEVWINGKKVGDTPIANLPYALGTHEIVFKHPQFGERRRTTTLRAGAPVALSVDMSKQ